MKPIVPHARANEDVLDALAHYLEQYPTVALNWIDALENTYRRIRRIQRHTGTGSPRYAHELNLPGLSFMGCGKFPYLVFNMESADSVSVWRILHTSRDIPAWME